MKKVQKIKQKKFKNEKGSTYRFSVPLKSVISRNVPVEFGIITN